MARACTLLVLALLVLLVMGSAGDASAAERTYAVIVGNRVPPTTHDGLRTLRYADDDALRYAQLFGRLPGAIKLLTVLDRDSRARNPDPTIDGTPTLKALRGAVLDLGKQAEAARSAGDHVTFVLVFSGHGAVRADGESFLAMLDGELTRQVMFEEIIEQFPADVVHVVIDACHAGGVVGVRGEEDGFGPEIDATTRSVTDADAERWLHARTLARFPHVGVLAAASAGEQAHEWSEIEAGVFSHEVLSGLWGAADINGDKRIEYSEVQAFVASANRNIDDPRAVPKIVAHAPDAFPHAAIVDLANLRDSVWVSGDASEIGRFHIELGSGVRHVDANLGTSVAAVAVPRGGAAFLRTDDREAPIDTVAVGNRRFEDLVLQPQGSEARGSTADAYRRGLFREPFNLDYYRGYIDSIDSPSVRFAARPRAVAVPRATAAVLEDQRWGAADKPPRRPRRSVDKAPHQRRAGIAMAVIASATTVAAVATGTLAGTTRAEFGTTDLEQRAHDLAARHRGLTGAAIATGSTAAVSWVVSAILISRHAKARDRKVARRHH
jgi:hypothetical protein